MIPEHLREVSFYSWSSFLSHKKKLCREFDEKSVVVKMTLNRPSEGRITQWHLALIVGLVVSQSVARRDDSRVPVALDDKTLSFYGDRRATPPRYSSTSKQGRRWTAGANSTR